MLCECLNLCLVHVCLFLAQMLRALMHGISPQVSGGRILQVTQLCQADGNMNLVF